MNQKVLNICKQLTNKAEVSLNADGFVMSDCFYHIIQDLVFRIEHKLDLDSDIDIIYIQSKYVIQNQNLYSRNDINRAKKYVNNYEKEFGVKQ